MRNQGSSPVCAFSEAELMVGLEPSITAVPPVGPQGASSPTGRRVNLPCAPLPFLAKQKEPSRQDGQEILLAQAPGSPNGQSSRVFCSGPPMVGAVLKSNVLN